VSVKITPKNNYVFEKRKIRGMTITFFDTLNVVSKKRKTHLNSFYQHYRSKYTVYIKRNFDIKRTIFEGKTNIIRQNKIST